MKKLNKLVKQLSDENYPRLRAELMQSGAEKSARLLELAFEHHFTDHEALKNMDMTPNAFYALKFRLNQKIQQFLLERLDVPQLELLRRVSMIPHMAQHYPVEMAEAALKKLEKDLQNFDLPYELVKVVKAQKQLNLFNRKKHYEISKRYNELSSYIHDIETLEDRVAEFFDAYGQFLLHRTDTLLDKLVFTKEAVNEIAARHSASHRLFTYNALIDVFFNLFLRKLAQGINNPLTVEEMLNRFDNFSDKYAGDPFYSFMEPIFDFFRFEYYHQLGYGQKEEQLFETVNGQLAFFLTKYDYVNYSFQFLNSKIEYARQKGKLNQLWQENEEVWAQEIDVKPNNLAGYYAYNRYLAVCNFYAGRYSEAARNLMNVRNETEVKKCEFAELELKLFLGLIYCLSNEEDLARQQISAARRMNRTLEVGSLESVNIFTKLLTTTIKNESGNREKNIKRLAESFAEANASRFVLLEFLTLDAHFIKLLISAGK